MLAARVRGDRYDGSAITEGQFEPEIEAKVPDLEDLPRESTHRQGTCNFLRLSEHDLFELSTPAFHSTFGPVCTSGIYFQ
jgi:hypothetical protein